MAADWPSGNYTARLVGAWWPQPASVLHAAADHWSAQQQQQERYALELHNKWTRLAAQNQGHTADDLISRFQRDERLHIDLSEIYKIKVYAFDKASDAVDGLREGLRGIADDYNQRIARVENSEESALVKTAEIENLIAEANGFASYKSGAAVAAIAESIQKIESAEGMVVSSHQFVAAHGRNANESLALATPTGIPGSDGAGLGISDHGGHTSEGLPGASGAGLGAPGSSGHLGLGAPAGSGAGAVAGGEEVVLATPASSAPMPGALAPSRPALSSLGGASPVSFSQGLSPSSLGQSVISAMATGQPAGAGAQSSGAMQATGAGAAPPPQPSPPALAPPVAPSIPPIAVSESFVPTSNAVDSVTNCSPPASTAGDGVQVASSVMTSGSWSAPAVPVAGGPVASTGPLLAYGSDLRPPVVTPPPSLRPSLQRCRGPRLRRRPPQWGQ